MKRWILLLGVLFLLAGNRPGTDVAKLSPIRALWMRADNGTIILVTDSGQTGIGVDFESALFNMEQSSPNRIFCKTAEYLLVTPDALPQISQVVGHLRPSCVVCQTEGEPVMNQAAQFLEHHGAETTLQQYRADGRKLPLLRTRDGRMTLVQ